MRVLLAGGGSGGSAAPVIAVGEALQRQRDDVEILYVGTTAGPEAALARLAGFRYVGIRSGRLRRFATWRNLIDPALVGLGFAQAIRLVRQFKPDVAFGAGGFATVPPLLAARVLGVPVAVHQQDVLPSLANRMVVPFASRVTVALAETCVRPRWADARVVGNPVRASIYEGSAERALTTFGLMPGLPSLLVTGGGTGALRLNQIAVEAVGAIIDRCQVIHLTGVGRAVTPQNHPRYRQYEFLTREMPDALALADVVVTRAGMSSLSEIAALYKAAIVVPMPATHQEANAAVFRKRRAGIVLDEPTLTPGRLADEVRSLLGDPGRRQSLGDAAAMLLPPTAADALAEELCELAASG
ncbi:MAG: murG [Chloroflexi bacterium]|nr:murG [Chloroflexota bacterium]